MRMGIYNLAAIEFILFEDTSDIETFECTWKYQNFDISGVNF